MLPSSLVLQTVQGIQSQTLLWFFHIHSWTWRAKIRKVLPLALAKPARNSHHSLKAPAPARDRQCPGVHGRFFPALKLLLLFQSPQWDDSCLYWGLQQPHWTQICHRISALLNHSTTRAQEPRKSFLQPSTNPLDRTRVAFLSSLNTPRTFFTLNSETVTEALMRTDEVLGKKWRCLKRIRHFSSNLKCWQLKGKWNK